MSRKVYRRYDPRLKNLVAKSNDISHFYKLGIPKSTLKQWKICGPLDYFSIPELDFNPTELLQENVILRTRTNRGGSPSSPNKVRLFYRQSAAVSFFVRLKNTYLTICPHCN